MTVGFIGTGNMARALARGIARSGESIVGFDVLAENLSRFCEETPAAAASGSREVAAQAQVTFLSVKPQNIDELMPEIAGAQTLVISILAGVTIARLERGMPRARVVRVMPNTPALVGAMAAGFAAGSRVTNADRETVARLLATSGEAVELPESLLDAVTALSGSGPAFVARLVQAFVDAGTGLGLSADISRRLTLATFAGTAKLLSERGLSPEELVKMVSSKGGTTEAGREILEQSDIAGVIRATVRRAAERSRELGG